MTKLRAVNAATQGDLEACTNAALLLHAISNGRKASQHARFWQLYRLLLPRPDQLTSSTMFEPEQYGWLQVRSLGASVCCVDTLNMHRTCLWCATTVAPQQKFDCGCT